MKTKIFVICFFLISVNIFCDDWQFIVTQDSPIYVSNIVDEPIGLLHKGEIIISNNIATYGFKRDGSVEGIYIGFKPDNGDYRRIGVENLLPKNTEEIFGTDIFENGKHILVSYCCDVLRSRNRETVFIYEEYYRKHQSDFRDRFENASYWYDEYDDNWSKFFVCNAVLSFGYQQQLIVNKIERTEYGYKVRCKEANGTTPDGKIPTLEWNAIEGKIEFDLLIYIDGDYIDLYADNTGNKVGTFVSVSDEFVRQYNNLIKTNSCDLTNVQWPRRADGSRDYSLPTSSVLEEPKQLETAELSVDTATETQLSAQNSPKTNNIPLWAWLAIGGAVVIAGVAVFVVRRKK